MNRRVFELHAPGGIRQKENQRQLNNSSIKKLFKKGEFALKCVYSNVDQLLYKMCIFKRRQIIV